MYCSHLVRRSMIPLHLRILECNESATEVQVLTFDRGTIFGTPRCHDGAGSRAGKVGGGKAEGVA